MDTPSNPQTTSKPTNHSQRLHPQNPTLHSESKVTPTVPALSPAHLLTEPAQAETEAEEEREQEQEQNEVPADEIVWVEEAAARLRPRPARPSRNRTGPVGRVVRVSNLQT